MTPAVVETAAAPPPLLRLEALDKRFFGTHALKGITLDLLPGEVHAIVGENGAGKSTLIKIMTGAHLPTSGRFIYDGREVTPRGPADALELGIDAVHQEMVLCPHLTVAANMFLGSEPARAGLLRERQMRQRAQAVLDDLGFAIAAGAILSSLTIGQQQLVAAARATLRQCRLIIFDEPTAYLTRSEAEKLFALIRRLHGQGVTIVYISHRLEEVFDIADRVSVLRDGRLVSTRPIADSSPDALIEEMVNRTIGDLHHKEDVPFGEELLRVEGLSGRGFSDVSVSVRRGEIVGFYGLVGAGRSEFVQAVFGRHRAQGGRMTLKGAPYAPRNVAAAIDKGVALVPESRRDQGLCLNLSVGFNINLAVFGRLSRLGLVQGARERDSADAQIEALRIRTAGRDAAAMTLSGGNQQKIVVGKWLNRGADLLIVDEPTVGVDVATKAELYRLFADLLRKGAGIILISSYLPEVYDLADTLKVMRRGRIVASYARGSASHETILADAIKG